MWLMIMNIYLKFEVDSLINKEETVKINIFLRKILGSRGDKSGNIRARVMNLVT
jgi:hypothetical protein